MLTVKRLLGSMSRPVRALKDRLILMASKHKRRARPAASAAGASLREGVDRLIAHERYKEAVKQAKICFKQEASPEHHRLLEQAYFLRLTQLQQGGMSHAAQEVARHLLDFGVTDSELIEPLATRLLALGMASDAQVLQDRLEAPEARARLIRQAADQAVLHPERASAAPPEVREGATRVRAALEALTAGDEATATAELRDVTRHSPFSDWKLFARGLAAFQRRADAEAHANWERLDPERAPARIARALRSLMGVPPGPPPPDGAAGPDVTAAMEGLERLTVGEPVLRPLRELSALIAQDRWTEAVRALRSLRPALQRIDPVLAERLTRVLYSPLIRVASRSDYHAAESLVGTFTKAAEPLPIDPRWNRLWARLWEGPRGGLDEAESFWRAYIDDLQTAPGLRPDERPMAQAMVWAHLGERFIDRADDLTLGEFGQEPDNAARDAARRRAVECLEESLRLCPTHRASYQTLLDAFEDWGQTDQAATAARRLLQALPDDFDTLIYLSDHHFHRDEPAEALAHALRARTLKPLDDQAVAREWAARVGMARHHALHRRWDDGRAELDAADRLRPELSAKLHATARRAVFELKAGQTDRAHAIIAEAQDRLSEPTPLWLALRIEATRYKLPRTEQDVFEDHWDRALSKKVRSETAGALAELIGSFLDARITYPGRDTHARQVVEYLRRTTRIKYQRADLRNVCAFLESLLNKFRQSEDAPRIAGGANRLRDLLEKLAKRGAKLFPDAPEFLGMLGQIEVMKGPFLGDLRMARTHYEKALKLAQAQESTDPEAAALLPKIKQALSSLTDLTAGPMGLPPFPFPVPSRGAGAMPGGFLDALEDLMDEMGIDPDDLLDMDIEEEDIAPPARAPRPRSAGRKTKPKK